MQYPQCECNYFFQYSLVNNVIETYNFKKIIVKKVVSMCWKVLPWCPEDALKM